MQAKIWNNSLWVNEVNTKVIKERIECILKDSEFQLLGFIEHFFIPQGYTAMWLLGESHCCIHTFPEEGKTYIELSSCNEEKYINFFKKIDLWLNTANIWFKPVRTGYVRMG